MPETFGSIMVNHPVYDGFIETQACGQEPRQVCEQLQESSNSEVKFSADFLRKRDVESMLPISMNTPI